MTKRNEAYDEGVEAGHSGFKDTDNPYKIGTDEAMDWEDGRASVIDDEAEEDG